MSGKQTNSLRYYHFMATLLALSIAALATYLVVGVNRTTHQNFKETQCNQGLLILATHGVWSENQIARCDPTIQKALREKYHR